MDRFHAFVHDPDTPTNLHAVLAKLEILYGLWTLEKHLGTYYEGLCWKIDPTHAFEQLLLIYIIHITHEDFITLYYDRWLFQPRISCRNDS